MITTDRNVENKCEMADTDISTLRAGVFHSAQEKQPSDVFTRLPSCNNDHKLVADSKVYTSRTV